MLKNTLAALTAAALFTSSAAIAADTGKTNTETSRPKSDSGVKKGADSGIKKGADAGKTSTPR
jgi:hypothetical protein